MNTLIFTHSSCTASAHTTHLHTSLKVLDVNVHSDQKYHTSSLFMLCNTLITVKLCSFKMVTWFLCVEIPCPWLMILISLSTVPSLAKTAALVPSDLFVEIQLIFFRPDPLQYYPSIYAYILPRDPVPTGCTTRTELSDIKSNNVISTIYISMQLSCHIICNPSHIFYLKR